jgi:hypothetical protein
MFLDLGYEVQNELQFLAKKVHALWLSPPKHLLEMEGSEDDLPHIFIFEFIVNELSLTTQVQQLFSMKESKPPSNHHKDHWYAFPHD